MQTHNGAVACQIIDALHPNVVPMSKVLVRFELCSKPGSCMWPDRLTFQLHTNHVAGPCCGHILLVVKLGLVQVKFNASTEYDMIQNYKVLQNVFNKLNLTKV